MDTTEKLETQDNEQAADANGGGSGEEPKRERTFTTEQVTEIVKRRLDQQERKHQQEIQELRETLTANIERAQHLEHDSYQVNKHREELEELREYKANRERQDMLNRISEEFGGVPVELLRGETDEELTESARALKEYADSFKPKVPETHAAGATPSPDGIASLYDTVKDRRERIERMAERHAMHG